MNHPITRKIAGLSVLLVLPAFGVVTAQPPTAADLPPPLNWTAAQDHQNMMDQLHITAPLRPKAAGTDTTSPLFANYFEAKSHATTPVPDVLTMANGQKVTTPAQWAERRKELLEIFDREIYGRVPEAAKTVKVTWEVTSTTQGMNGAIPIITRQLVGHVDNSSYPLISVNIGASVTTPADATGPVPVIIVFGGGGGGPAPAGARGAPGAAGGVRGAPGGPGGAAAGARGGPAGFAAPPPSPNADELATINAALKKLVAGADPAAQKIFDNYAGYNPIPIPPALGAAAGARGAPGAAGAPGARGPGGPGVGGGSPWQALALAKGWGYGSLNPGSIQADNGAGLTSGGIIALINKGQARKPDDWGSLRAWAWGADRLLDFFATDKLVDGKQVAFEGHSRYGKATIVTLAYDERAATGYVSSSGEGGAKLWRHLVGETVENLADPSEYYWMAGNFIKYAGPLTVNDLPIDAHELVALVAPRPVFTGGGFYIEGGVPYSNELWQDAPGTLMATAGASPVYELLGKKGVRNDALNLRYDGTGDLTAITIPPMLTPLIDGDLAFRQHDGPHTDAPNWPTFIEFASRYLHAPGK